MALRTLHKAGVEGVMVDVWWGIVEQAPGQYDFSAYRRLFEKIADSNLKVQVGILSSIVLGWECGGEPSPAWGLVFGTHHLLGPCFALHHLTTAEDGGRLWPQLFGRTVSMSHVSDLSSVTDLSASTSPSKLAAQSAVVSHPAHHGGWDVLHSVKQPHQAGLNQSG